MLTVWLENGMTGLTLKDISGKMKVGVPVLRQAINVGRLKARKVGRSYFVTFVDFDIFNAKYGWCLKQAKTRSARTLIRDYTCGSYSRCLNVAAVRNTLFTCNGCADRVCSTERRY